MTPRGDGQRVLLVEDELMLAVVLEETLKETGYEVVGPVGRLDAAIRAAREEDFTLALLDINLHGQRVFPVADVLTERGIPFVFLSGYDNDVLPPAYAAAEMLRKPVRTEQLLARLAVHCRRPQAPLTFC